MWGSHLQLLEPVEHYLNLRTGGRAGCACCAALSGRDDAEEPLAVERDVIAPLATWAAVGKSAPPQNLWVT